MRTDNSLSLPSIDLGKKFRATDYPISAGIVECNASHALLLITSIGG